MTMKLRKGAVQSLLTMHTYARPAYSRAEAEFSDRFLRPLRGCQQDGAGNWIATVGANPNILWSAHTDTVHRKSGRQNVTFGGGLLSLAANPGPSGKSSCLGADCSVGVWLLREMFLARVPGLYVWHAAEEIGCRGSGYIATHRQNLLTGIDAAIAFDRLGTSEIITHQMGARTASDAFAVSLARVLSPHVSLAPSDGGTFTDTNEYAGLVPECTNVSVGYEGAHSSHEFLNVDYACDLLRALLQADFDSLIFEREPGDDGYGDQPGWLRDWLGEPANDPTKGRAWDDDNPPFDPYDTQHTYAPDGLDGWTRFH